jgi:hypothetical protein
MFVLRVPGDHRCSRRRIVATGPGDRRCSRRRIVATGCQLTHCSRPLDSVVDSGDLGLFRCQFARRTGVNSNVLLRPCLGNGCSPKSRSVGFVLQRLTERSGDAQTSTDPPANQTLPTTLTGLNCRLVHTVQVATHSSPLQLANVLRGMLEDTHSACVHGSVYTVSESVGVCTRVWCRMK